MIINLPFAALRAFEAVVRHQGFSSAAAELGVSQSAISQHVKSLEEWLGHELLVRGARQSSPTIEGEQLATATTEGLGRISDVCNRLRDRETARNKLVISCLPGFAFVWLFPRLMRFDLAHPHLSLSIATDTGERPFAGADIGIRYGLGDYPGLKVQKLMGERLFPVCTPELALKLKTPSDLTGHTLLQDENLKLGPTSPNWEYWARATGVTLPAKSKTRRFGQSNMVVQAAISGLGVALGREPLVVDALAEGRLVRPLPQITASPLSYWLVTRTETQESAKIREFLDWASREAAEQPSLPEALSSA